MTLTVGKAALDAQKNDIQTDYIELEREIHQGKNSKRTYEEEVWEAVDRGRKDASIVGDFFVVVLFKKERHLQNVVRQMFFYRKTCPTPEYDQTVYKYCRQADALDFVWCIPNNATVINMILKKHLLPPEQQWLVSLSEAFQSGELEELAQKMNKEDEGSHKGLILHG